MKKILFLLAFGALVFAGQASATTVYTNAATNLQYGSVTLNGYAADFSAGANTLVWFQWGTTTNYGNETPKQALGSAGSFSQQITGLAPTTAYRFRAVAQNSNGTFYGQDAGIYTGSSSTQNGNLLIRDCVINLTQGDLNWKTTTSARPGDILSFAVVLQAQNATFHNVNIRDILPAGLIYKGNLTINSHVDNTQNPANGINLGDLPAGNVAMVGYQAQVQPESYFAYGTTSLSTTAKVWAQELPEQTANATASVSKSFVQGAFDISTGLTNNFWQDSFFVPLSLIILGLWFYFSGGAHKFADWLKARR